MLTVLFELFVLWENLRRNKLKKKNLHIKKEGTVPMFVRTKGKDERHVTYRKQKQKKEKKNRINDHRTKSTNTKSERMQR